MVKSIFRIIITIALSAAAVMAASFYASAAETDGAMYEIKLKAEKKARVVKVVDMSMGSVKIRESDGAELMLRQSQIEYVKIIDKSDKRFKKVIILTNRSWHEGHIIFQDRNKMSVEIGGDLKSFNVDEVEDVVGYKDFHSELKKSPWKAFGWSCLYPGAGQLYTSGKEWKGILFMTGFTLTAAAGAYFTIGANAAWDRYESGRYKDRGYYDTYKNYGTIAICSFSVAGALYIWSILDAYFNFDYRYPFVKEMKRTTASRGMTSILEHAYVDSRISPDGGKEWRAGVVFKF